MPTINENFLKLEKNYLFINIAKKVNAYIAAHPEADIIRMGIGDVTQPIAKCVVEAMKKGADEMGVKETFKGYEDSGAGYDFHQCVSCVIQPECPEYDDGHRGLH